MTDEAYKWFWVGAVVGPFIWCGVFWFFNFAVEWFLRKIQ